MKKIITTTLITVVMTFLTGVQPGMALKIDKEKPTKEMKAAFSADVFESDDKSDEGLCSGIGDFKNKKCPPVVQEKTENVLENIDQQEESTEEGPEVVEVIVETPVYIPVEVNNPDESESEQKGEDEKNKEKEKNKNDGKILGVSNIRQDAAAENNQQILLLSILVALTLTLTLMTEVRTQKMLQQIQEQISKAKQRRGKRPKK